MQGDIYIDGKKAEPMTLRQRAKAIIDAGFFDGSIDDLCTMSPTGELWHVFYLHWYAMYKTGHRVEVEERGKLEPLYSD